MLPGNQKTRDAANQKTSSKCDDVGHKKIVIKLKVVELCVQEFCK